MTTNENSDTADPEIWVACRSATHWTVLLFTLISSSLSSYPTVFICTMIKCRFAVIKKTGHEVIKNMNKGEKHINGLIKASMSAAAHPHLPVLQLFFQVVYLNVLLS